MYQESFGSAFRRGYMSMPPLIRTIITINVVIFLIQALAGTGVNQLLVNLFAFDPQWQVALTQPWRLVTYMFLHGSGFHLLFNMLWLWWMGRPVEEQLGPRNFLVIYFGAGIGGALVNLVFSPFFPATVTIGASGAVFGMMVAFAMLFPRIPIMLLFFPPIQARFLVAGLIAIDLLFISSGDNVARIVHLGGALWGYILLKMYLQGYHYDLWIEQWKQRFKSKKPAQASRSRSAPEGPGRRSMRKVTDAEIVEEYSQDELDRILDKISKSGYEGLTAEEKRLLFELSKKN